MPEGALEEYVVWLTVERGRSRATVEAYRRDLEQFLAFVAPRGIEEVSSEDLTSYVASLRVTRAPASVARAIASLRGWFGFLVAERVLASDPTDYLRGLRRASSLPKPLGEAEVARLIDAVPDATPRDRRDRVLLELLYGTGCRVSEAVGVRLEDLDRAEGLITVIGKGDRQRLVPLGAALATALDHYLAPGGRPALARSTRETHLLLNSRGGVLTRQGVDVVIARRALVVGIPRHSVSAHVLRHSCATHMLEHGADIRVVQELLGHASVATTQLYTAVSNRSLRDVYARAHPRAQE